MIESMTRSLISGQRDELAMAIIRLEDAAQRHNTVLADLHWRAISEMLFPGQSYAISGIVPIEDLMPDHWTEGYGPPSEPDFIIMDLEKVEMSVLARLLNGEL